MMKKSEPWYIHAALYLVIAILAYILIRVAIVDPTDFMEKDKYYKTESHLRMSNIRQAQIMYEKKNGRYTDDLSALINFVKTDSAVLAAINGVDSLTERSTNPFEKLTVGSFVPESLMYSPKSHTPFILKIDRTTKIDTVINMKGKVIRVDTVKTIGSIYQLESPDGYGQIGDLESPTKKNTASWE
ncbi:MAG: hypothetical protein KDC90_02725 [Ignavibacteriae bacterium]|nr:hypothetical protein [Ignavibacteriota bacterium]